VIVDAHTDVLLELVVREGAEPPFELVLREGETGVFTRYWLPKLVAGGVGIQICPLYGEGARRHDARERTLAQLEEFTRLVEEHSEQVCQVYTAAELDDPRLRLVLSLEGVEPTRWLDHFDHAVEVMGIGHVGLGADLVDQLDPAHITKKRFALDGFISPEDFPSLVTALRDRGYDGNRLEGITSGNWLRILRETL